MKSLRLCESPNGALHSISVNVITAVSIPVNQLVVRTPVYSSHHIIKVGHAQVKT